MHATARNRFILASLSLLLLTISATAAIQDVADWAKPGVTVVAGQLYVKFNPAVTPLKITVYDGTPLTGIPNIDAVAGIWGVTGIEQTFIGETHPKDPKAIDLSCYYTITFPEEIDPTAVGESYEKCPEVLFAEHVRLTRIEFIPDDPRYRAQWHLAHCGFEQAWDYTHGSRDVVIGIVDSGMDMPIDENNEPQVHEDIMGNLWVNPGEDIDHDGVITWEDVNGEDDEGDGFADDFHGWDLTGRDNWPDDPHGGNGGVGHGTHVAGIASAATDNNIGGSGAAFSASIMVAGCYTVANDQFISNGYPGINYCVRAGAKVINLSWGSRSPASNTENEVIRNAIENGVIIFAAAGNDSLEDLRAQRLHHYPSSYDGVICIAASNDRDLKTDFSVYGDYIDLVAPGENILSTVPHNRYVSYPGTSMASPLAAGLGALMLSVEPTLSNDELLEWMQRTATDISELNNDLNGIKYLINADFLINSTHPKYALTDSIYNEINGNHDGQIDPEELISFEFTLSNLVGYLDAFDVFAEISNPDPMVQIVTPRIELGAINNGVDVINTGENTLRFTVRRQSRPHYSTFTLTVGDASDFRQTVQLPVTIGHPYNLYVDDDGEDTYERFYNADLAERPIVHSTWNTATQGVPPLAVLSGYESIIWACGNTRNGLSEAEQGVLVSWLELPNHQGLVLSGQYLADDIGETPFHTNYLHARLVTADNDGSQLTGVADNPISAGLGLLLVGGAGAGNNQSPSSLEPINGGDTLFTYARVGGVGATFFTNGDYSVAYTGFSLEAVSGQGQSASRADFLGRCLDRFFVLDAPVEQAVAPTEFSLNAPWPNPFNATTRITVAAPANRPYRLEVTDLAGRSVAVLADGKSIGGNSFVWNADAFPAGIYLFRLSWDGGSLAQKAALVK